MMRDDFLDAADAGVAQIQHLDLPALALGVARVHAEQVRREQRRLVAAGAGADFEHDVLRVVGILRNEEDLQLGEQRVARASSVFISSCASSRMSGSLSELLGRGDLRDDVLVSRNVVDERLHLRERLRVRAELGVSAWTAGSAISAISCSYRDSAAVSLSNMIESLS